MWISWTFMLTQGPLVGEARTDTLEEAVDAVRDALKDALVDRYGDLHEQSLMKLAAALRAGERSWRTSAVWVELRD